MNIIFDYLTDSDRQNLPYRSVENQLQLYDPVLCKGVQEFKQNLLNLGQLQENSIITILSHGHERGLAKETWESLFVWCELVETISRCKGEHRLTLNLLSTCNSNRILNSLNFCRHRIDEVWITSNNVISINKSLLAITANSFVDFWNELDEEEQILYSKWIIE